MAAVAVSCLAVLGGCGSPQSGLVSQGNTEFERGDYQGATRTYQRAAVESPDLPEPYYNAGNSLLRQREHEVAARHLMQALTTADSELGADAAYSLGNVHFRSGNYSEAADAYRASLRLDPWAQDAKHNLELALRRLQEENQEEQETDPAAEPTPEADSGGQDEEEQAEGTEGDLDVVPSEGVGQDEPLTREQARRLLEALSDAAGTLDQQQLPLGEGLSERPQQDW